MRPRLESFFLIATDKKIVEMSLSCDVLVNSPQKFEHKCKKGRQNETTTDDVLYVFTVFAPLGHAQATRILCAFCNFSGFAPRAMCNLSKNVATKSRVPQKMLRKAMGVYVSCFWTLVWTPIEIRRLFKQRLSTQDEFFVLPSCIGAV